MPAFKTGNPGGPGRKKGTKIVSTQAKVREIISKYGDPLEGLAALASEELNDNGLRLQAYKELAKYCYAPRKAEDGEGDSGETVTLILDMPKR